MVKNCNDGSNNPPALRCYISGGNVATLPAYSRGPHGDEAALLKAVKAAGYDGVQGMNGVLAAQLGLAQAGGGRINKVGEAGPIAEKLKAAGNVCATFHVGWGLEDDAAVFALVEDILKASGRHGLPLYIETHRATIAQDIWRTLQIVKRFPEVRFNGDFSHWYTGLEMVYGGIEMKWDAMAPVFERVRFIHGRIGNPGSMQVDIGDGAGRPYVDHFREMWTRSFAGFLKTAQPGDFICFTPELLEPRIYYARLIKNAKGEEVEESDRWEQALVYVRIARECFAEAQRRVKQ